MLLRGLASQQRSCLHNTCKAKMRRTHPTKKEQRNHRFFLTQIFQKSIPSLAAKHDLQQQCQVSRENRQWQRRRQPQRQQRSPRRRAPRSNFTANQTGKCSTGETLKASPLLLNRHLSSPSQHLTNLYAARRVYRWSRCRRHFARTGTHPPRSPRHRPRSRVRTPPKLPLQPPACSPRDDPFSPPELQPLADLSISLYPAFLDHVANLSGPPRSLSDRTHPARPPASPPPVLCPPTELNIFLPAHNFSRSSTFTLLDEQSIDPRQLAPALIAAAANTSITLHTGTPVLGVESSGSERLTVVTPNARDRHGLLRRLHWSLGRNLPRRGSHRAKARCSR